MKRISIAVICFLSLISGAQAQQKKAVEHNESSFSKIGPIVFKAIQPALLATNSLLSSSKNKKFELNYSEVMDKAFETVKNLSLINFIDNWYNTKYKFGGTSQHGIDCSSFTNTLLSSVYGIMLPRTAKQQFAASIPVSETSLREGDLVFFNTTGGISHVGIYLVNRLFIHASSSKGVTISSLDDPYFKKRFIRGGRPSSELLMNAYL